MKLFELFGTISVDNADAIKKISETNDTAEESGSRLSAVFSKVGSIAKTSAIAIGSALAGASVAVGKLTADSVGVVADYEQLVGGVETLFGDSANRLMGFAQNAYKTAGLSANDYMETVTSFSASLIASLDGDTAQAVNKADLAIRDMSDNANRMGSDVSSIQFAYAGFAKQNFTLLDNLKIGYAGTKEEMERLLADAEKISGIKYDISSYADIVDAVHVVQTEMGITGTTAKEASTTISGSLNSLKASWQNVLVAMSDDSMNLKTNIQTLSENAVTVISNVLPRIQTALSNIPTMVTKLTPQIVAVIQTLLPTLVESAVSVLNSFVAVLPDIIDAIIDILPMLLEALTTITASIVEALPEITNSIIEFLVDPEVITGIVEAGVVLFSAILTAIPQIAIQIIDNLPAIFDAFKTGITNGLSTMSESLGDIHKLWQMAMGKLTALLGDIGRKLLQPIHDALENAKDWVKTKVSDIATKIKDGFNKAKDNVTDIFDNIQDAIKTKIEKARDFVKDAIDKIKEFFKFEWKLPDLKLPHFKFTGEFSLSPLSVPKLSVDWYAQGGILNQPTLFDYNPFNGKAKVGGEAGAEAIAPIDTLLGYVKTAVAEETGNNFERLISILSEYLPNIANNSNRKLVLDSGALVGELAPAMDARLGSINSIRNRGG